MSTKPDMEQLKKFEEDFLLFLQFTRNSSAGAQNDAPSTSHLPEATEQPTPSTKEKHRVVLINVPESNGNTAKRKTRDLLKIEEILASIVDLFNIVRHRRDGKLQKSQRKPRAIVVNLSKESEERRILKKARKLKKVEKWKMVTIEEYSVWKKKEETSEEELNETQSLPEPEPEEEPVENLVSSNPFRNFDAIEPSSCKKERNILIIGATGVGKSTWINGVANYMKFDSFDDALRSWRPPCVIPMEFNLCTGESLEMVTISMKPDNHRSVDRNEASSSSGQSCTQFPKVYRFITDTIVFNLIDTPGIGDTRGMDCDMDNMRTIMQCISGWDKIHGICILLKPNQSRLDLPLRYCIMELLVNLHHNSIPNISVVFTNTCGTLYKPGDTMTVLKELLEDVKSSQQYAITLTDANTFCIDNEPIRMLYAHHKGVEFERAHVENYTKSWNHTLQETYRLFDYVTDLNHHQLNETQVVSIVRGITQELCSILVDIDEQIKQEEKIVAQQTAKNKTNEQKLDETKKENVIQGEYLEETPITVPNTVCCGPNCIEAIKDPKTGKTKNFHKNVCLQGCSQDVVNVPVNAPVNQIGAANLRQFKIFDSSGNCTVCGCSWQQHMHILFSQTKVTGSIEMKNDKATEEAAHLDSVIQSKTKLIAENQIKVDVLKENYRQVQQLTKPYLDFLENNSILLFNKAFEEYAEFSIELAEKTLKTGENRFEIEQLNKLLATQRQQKSLQDVTLVDGHEEITLNNYSIQILALIRHQIVGKNLANSTVYANLFDKQICDINETTRTALTR